MKICNESYRRPLDTQTAFESKAEDAPEYTTRLHIHTIKDHQQPFSAAAHHANSIATRSPNISDHCSQNFSQHQVEQLHTGYFDTWYYHTGFASHYGDGSWFGDTRPDLDMRVEILVDEVKDLPVKQDSWRKWYTLWLLKGYGDYFINAKIDMRLRFWVTKQDGEPDLAVEVHCPSAEAVFNAVEWGGIV